ncbi:unnamed protein product [Microthlaspi erraticum]|uniref:MATH domain-containing protein n=1 Tax=Microthlaspi erraticum TaxID=1685480 RepID=A0A6D2KDS5_9BRAS|nr:unnamed protein product [Microthlaspi erraticum]
MSHYRNTISFVSLLLCLFITFASSERSYIREFTDDFNSNLHQPDQIGAEPNPNLEETHYSDNHQEMSSSDNSRASSIVKGLRNQAPSSYSLKMESFRILLNSTDKDTESYRSRPFPVGEYSWTLVVYPNGNKRDNGTGFLSLYVAIDNSTLVASHRDVYADLKFYIFNKNERKYFTIQDTTVWRFNVFKTMWGFSQALPLDTFRDSRNGYLYDGDHCEFGVDVTIPTHFDKSELFTITQNFPNPTYTWTIQRFSTLHQDFYFSDVFSIGERRWKLQVYPNGDGMREGRLLSMYLHMDENEKIKPDEKIYVRAKLRVLNKNPSSNVEKLLDMWYGAGSRRWGYDFIPLSDLKSFLGSFLGRDELRVQVEMEAISSTMYFPS